MYFNKLHFKYRNITNACILYMYNQDGKKLHSTRFKIAKGTKYNLNFYSLGFLSISTFLYFQIRRKEKKRKNCYTPSTWILDILHEILFCQQFMAVHKLKIHVRTIFNECDKYFFHMSMLKKTREFLFIIDKNIELSYVSEDGIFVLNFYFPWQFGQ